MTSVSAGHIIQTPTQPVGSGRPQRESNPGPPHQESRALPQSYRAPIERAKGRQTEGQREKEDEKSKFHSMCLAHYAKKKKKQKKTTTKQIYFSSENDKLEA